jgi:hypothetical protein
MTSKGGYLGWAVAAAAGVTLVLSPAVGAAADLIAVRSSNPVSLGSLGSIGSFTPATKDPRLSAAYASAVLNGGRKTFRFTPTSGSTSGRRSITVLVRAEDDVPVRMERTIPSVGITPVAFNLNVARGWRKFALPDSVGRAAIDPIPVEAPIATRSFSLEQGKKRFSTNVLVDSKSDVGASSASVDEKAYSLQVGSSYSLSRNLNVTAGMRYSGRVSRLAPIADDRKDAQAVYLGTIFKF